MTLPVSMYAALRRANAALVYVCRHSEPSGRTIQPALVLSPRRRILPTGKRFRPANYLYSDDGFATQQANGRGQASNSHRPLTCWVTPERESGVTNGGGGDGRKG